MSAEIDGTPFYSVASLARRLAVSEKTIRTMLNRGDIPCYRVGAQRRIDPSDVCEWLARQRGKPTTAKGLRQ